MPDSLSPPPSLSLYIYNLALSNIYKMLIVVLCLEMMTEYEFVFVSRLLVETGVAISDYKLKLTYKEPVVNCIVSFFA